jgi:hypothetical protein
MRVTAGSCPFALIVWDFNQDIFPFAPWIELDRNPRTGAQNGAESALRAALPGMIYPGITRVKSTRPTGTGSPATGLRRWGGVSGDLLRN